MHVIRLREPWEIHSGTSDGQWIFRRKFHRPTGAEADSVCLHVTVSGVSELQVVLNGKSLSQLSRHLDDYQYLLSEHLQAFNLLELSVTGAAPESGSPRFGTSLVHSVEIKIASEKIAPLSVEHGN